MKKTILITGASSGIGKATSLYFARQDWNVIATMRNPERETELINEPNIFVTKLEVTDSESIETAIQQGIEKFGQIDALLNNAGYGQRGLFEAITPDKIQSQFDVNVFGVMNVTRVILPYFRKQQEGVIVNITSGVGKIPFPLVSVYTASKYAVEGFVESLAYEVESQNIKVKIVEPGFVVTNFQQRASMDSEKNDSSIGDYAPFIEETNALFSGLSGVKTASAEDVAAIVYTAATDGTHTLRYVAGPDIQPMIAARKDKTEQEYVSFLRGLFAPNGFDNRK